MTNKTIAQKNDDQLLALMLEVSAFIKGERTLSDLQKAEENAEMYRCWQPLTDEDSSV
jgi:hypothetical protein